MKPSTEILVQRMYRDHGYTVGEIAERLRIPLAAVCAAVRTINTLEVQNLSNRGPAADTRRSE